MKKQNIFTSMLLLSIGCCSAQSIFGPKITAMGQNSAAVADIWNVIGNPALVVVVPTPTIGMNYMRYFETEVNSQSFGLVLPIRNQALGFYIRRYGILPYHEISMGTMICRNFGNSLSLALRINFHQLKIESYGTTAGFSLDLGTTFKLTDQLLIGSYFNNISFQKYSNSLLKTVIPSAAYLGLCYLISDKLTIASTASKEFGAAIAVSFGFDYQLLQSISFRVGLTTSPFKQYGGFGLKYKKLTVDLAVQSDPFLAYTPQIGIAYAF